MDPIIDPRSERAAPAFPDDLADDGRAMITREAAPRDDANRLATIDRVIPVADPSRMRFPSPSSKTDRQSPLTRSNLLTSGKITRLAVARDFAGACNDIGSTSRTAFY